VSGEPARWGFHQLRDSEARRLVSLSRVGPGDLVVDLGAGHGVITRYLVGTGAAVIAVELHPERAARLRRTFAAECAVVTSDLATFRLPSRPFRVVANPPFGQLAMLLRRLTSRHSQMRRADLVVPAYLAARCARGAHPSAARYAARVARRLRFEAFDPPATQPTAVLTLVRSEVTAPRRAAGR
jgi:23S rRNA (adenine-N6)-dimethyltransferase